MTFRSPALYRVTIELLSPSQHEVDRDFVGVYCFDSGRRPLEMAPIDSLNPRYSFDIRTRAMGLYISGHGESFVFGPWYRSPDRKAVDGDIFS